MVTICSEVIEHAAAEGGLDEAVVVCVVACVATRGPDKSPAVTGRDCLHHVVFRDTMCLTMQVALVQLDGNMPRALHLLRADHGGYLQTLAEEHWMHLSSMEGQQAMAVAVTGAKASMLKDADFNDAVQCWGPAHSLSARNNEAVIPPVAMAILNDCTVNTDQD